MRQSKQDAQVHETKHKNRHMKDHEKSTSIQDNGSEYASTVKDPPYQIHISDIETVQRRDATFTLNQHCHNTCTVEEMLETLKWPTQQQHQQAAHLTMLCKITDASDLAK